MNCPRCGVSAQADHGNCPACQWQLTRPYADESLPPLDDAKNEEAVEMQTAADAFALTPPEANGQSRARARFGGRRGGRWGTRRWSRESPLRAEGEPPAGAPEDWSHPRHGWPKPPPLEVLEMPVTQAAFDFSAAEEEAERLALPGGSAPVDVRALAGLFDGLLIFGAAVGFFGLFVGLAPWAAGASVNLGRRDLLICLVVSYLLATLYFGLFTLVGGRTPGMVLHGLQVATFEGQPLTKGRALARALGYAVSIGSLLLGFFWAAVDDRRLSWHDHISRTFITDRPLS